jgi:hypothetical protein
VVVVAGGRSGCEDWGRWICSLYNAMAATLAYALGCCRRRSRNRCRHGASLCADRCRQDASTAGPSGRHNSRFHLRSAICLGLSALHSSTTIHAH